MTILAATFLKRFSKEHAFFVSWILTYWAVGLATCHGEVANTAPIPDQSSWRATSSANQGRQSADLAVDGDLATRWNSPTEDGHWLQIDLGQPATVSGFRLHWEFARAGEYRVLHSDDAENWETCRSIKKSTGLIDQFYFPSVTRRYWRIWCDRRATRWANSLWEVELLGTHLQPVISRAEEKSVSPLPVFMDGDSKTVWRGSNASRQEVIIDLRRSSELAGLNISWGQSSASAARLDSSIDGEDWLFVADKALAIDEKGLLILGPKHKARYLRLTLDASPSGKPIEISEIELRGPEEAVGRMNVCRCTYEKDDGSVPSNGTPVARGHDSRIDIEWPPITEHDVRGYNVYRADLAAGPFTKINSAIHEFHVFSDFLGENNRTCFYRVTHIDGKGTESAPSEVATATSASMTDEQLLTSVQESAFRYFWDFVDPHSGLARESYTKPCEICTNGGTGFGMMTIMVGAERKFISRKMAAQRLLKTVRFLEDNVTRYHGVWPHWFNGRTGETIPFSKPFDNGGDIVETAFLIQGMLTIRQYFDQDNPIESELRERITRLWEEVEWDWYLREPGNKRLYWHWSPNYEWKMSHQFTGFNECLITYVLAIASPTHSIPLDCYEEGWVGNPARYANGKTLFGYVKPVGRSGDDPLFFTHYSFLGLDPHQLTDQYCNYFANNRNTSLINRAYCIANPEKHKGYGEKVWGLTASTNPDGYKAHAPSPETDDGTIAPTAAICAIPYTPEESIATLRHLYHEYGDRLWGPFGFYDAFNLDRDWVSPTVLAIDQGPMAPMIENYRSQLCWKMFMANPEIGPVLEKLRP